MAVRLERDNLAWAAGLVAACAVIGLLSALDPRLGISAALGLALMLIVAADLTLGVCAFVFMSFLTRLPGFGGPVLSASKALGVILVLSWIATMAARPEVRRDLFTAHPGFVWALGLFLAWGAISVMWAESPGVAAVAVSRYALNLMLFPIVYTAIRERRHALWFAVAFVAGALISAVYGIATQQDPTRLSGAGLNANDLATMLVAGLVLAGALAAIYKRSPITSAAAIGAAVLCGAATFLTLSRAGLLALGVTLLVGVFVASRRRGWVALLAMIVAVSGILYFGALAGPGARERITTLGSGTGRVDIWKVAGRVVRAHTLNGVGAGNFRIVSVHYLLEPGTIERSDLIVDQPKVAHNIYLDVLTELGVIGLVPFLAILVLAMSYPLRAVQGFRVRGDPDLETLSRALFVAEVGVLAAAFFASIQFNNQLWLLFALGPALLAISRAGADTA